MPRPRLLAQRGGFALVNKDIYEPVARESARRYDVDEETFVRQIAQESGFRPDAFNSASGATGIAQIIPRWHPGVDATDPYASLDYAAKLMAGYYRQFGSWRNALAAYNWGPGNVGGYAHNGIITPPWDGRRETLPSETRHYLDVILGEGWPEPNSNSITHAAEDPISALIITEDGVRLRSGPGTDSRVLATLKAGTEAVPITDHAWRQVNVNGQAGWIAADYLAPIGTDSNVGSNSRQFDPNTPTYYQRLPWTCAVGSTIWMLRSIGIDVTPEDAHDAMVPAYVNERLGLLDGSGAGIVEVLRERWGVKAHTLDRPGGPTFDDVLALAGKQPVAIGGRNWGGAGLGHWSAVRGRYEDALILANPARGDRFGQTTLTRQDWQRLGGFSAVVVDL